MSTLECLVLVFGLLGSCIGDTHEYVPYANYYDTYTPGSTVTGGTVIYPRSGHYHNLIWFAFG